MYTYANVDSVLHFPSACFPVICIKCIQLPIELVEIVQGEEYETLIRNM